MIGGHFTKFLEVGMALCLLTMISAGCSKKEPTKEQYLSLGNEYLETEQYDKAANEYRNVLRLAPNDPTAIRQLGAIYFDQAQLPQALLWLRKSAELEPQNPEVRRKLGKIYLSAHAYKEARDAALSVLILKPGDEEALLLLADTAVTPKEIGDTQLLIEQLRDQGRDSVGYHLALGELALHQKELARAEMEYSAALAMDPNSSLVHLALANLYWSRQDLPPARKEFKIAAELAPSRSQGPLRYGEFLLLTGDVADARNLVQDLIRKAPDYLPPRVLLMKVLCADVKSAECASAVHDVLQRDPVDYDALFHSGLISLAKEDKASATRLFEKLIALYPDNPEARYQLALAYLVHTMDVSTLDKAVVSLNTAIRLKPNFDQAILLLAKLKLIKSQSTEAIDLLTPLIKVSPQIAEAHFLLARAYLAQRNQQEALVVYHQMAELFPKDPQVPFSIGTVLLSNGQRSDARKLFEQSLAISPEFLPALEKIVELDIAEKQPAKSIDPVQQLIDKNPNQAELLVLRAKISLAQKDFDHAEADLLKAINIDPNLQSAYLMLASLYVASNRQEKAIKELTAFVEKNSNAPALMQLASIEESLKHFDAARNAYEKLLAAYPEFFPALNRLAVLNSEHLGRLDAAYDLAMRVRRFLPEDPGAADTLGWILFKKGEYGKAAQLLQESANKLPGVPEVQFRLGMAHYMMGEEEPARIALQKAAASSQEFPDKDEAQQRLSILALDTRSEDPGLQSVLEAQLRDRPEDPEARLRLAELQERDGNVAQAIKNYQAVLDQYPNFVPAARRFALLSSKSSIDAQKTYEVAMKATRAYPDDPELAKVLGILDCGRGSYRQCAEELQKAAATRKDDPELLYQLGMAYYQLKRLDEARQTLERVVSLNASPKFTNEAKQALANCCQGAKAETKTGHD